MNELIKGDKMNELTKTEQAGKADWEIVEEEPLDYVMLDGKKCYASKRIYVDPRILVSDMSEEEASTWNQPNQNPEMVWTAVTVPYTRTAHREHYSIIEPWDPKKTPIKLNKRV